MQKESALKNGKDKAESMMEHIRLHPQEFRTGDEEPGKNAPRISQKGLNPMAAEGG